MLENVTTTLSNRLKSLTFVAQELLVFVGLAISVRYLGNLVGFDVFGVITGVTANYVGRNVKNRAYSMQTLGVDRTDLGSEGNQWHSDDRKELQYSMPLRATKKDNENYINTRALNNNLSVSDKYDTLYRSPNAYEPAISENDISTKILGRPG
jgi:hypothetical protein